MTATSLPAFLHDGVHSYRPLERRARWAVDALAAMAFVELVVIAATWQEHELLGRALAGEYVTLAEVEANDARVSLVGFVELGVLVVTAVLFIRWFHAAYSNLRALGHPGLRFGSGWAIGSWFVPVLNLWRPKQIANDIWAGSDPAAPPLAGKGWKDVSPPQLLGLWWALWLGSSIVSNFAARAFFGTPSVEDVRNADRLELVACSLTVVAALVAIAVVRSLTSRQGERMERLADSGA